MRPSNQARMNTSVESIVKACKEVFGNELRCIILKGSAFKGDFVPNYSDVDIHVYVEPIALEDDRTPKLEFALKFQEAIGQLSPKDAGVSQFQISFLSADRSPEDWSPPVRGTYRILYGTSVPAMERIPLQEYLERQWLYLEQVEKIRLELLRRFVDKPNSSIPMMVRLTGTYLKGILYALSSVLSKNPEETFSCTLEQLLSDVLGKVPDLSYARDFFGSVKDWTSVENDPIKAREAFAFGIGALKAIEKWRSSNPKPF